MPSERAAQDRVQAPASLVKAAGPLSEHNKKQHSSQFDIVHLARNSLAIRLLAPERRAVKQIVVFVVSVVAGRFRHRCETTTRTKLTAASTMTNLANVRAM